MSATENPVFVSLRRTASETRFSGVVSVTLDGATITEAWGLADRAQGMPNTVQTRFGTASGTKGFTAVAIACLIEEQRLTLATPARDVIGSAIRNLPDDVTIRHLLTHTSGIGDYYDEEAIGDALAFAQSLPLDRLHSLADFIPLLEAAPPKFPPGERFSYCNSGFVVLALVIESISGRALHEFLGERVFRAAGMNRSGLFRYDALPDETALGYVKSADGWQPNSHLLPVRGGGDGGACSTIADLDRFWDAWLGGKIVRRALVDEFTSPQARDAKGRSYGCGFWLRPERSLIYLEGYDPGISFRSLTNRENGDRYTVIANTASGAWPLVRGLDEAFGAKE